MSNVPAESPNSIALEYYRSIRAEVVERLKARDTILLAYLGAVAVLLGLPSSTAVDRDFLPFVVPLLGFATAASIAQHQELVTTLTVYLAGEWNQSLSPRCPVPPPELSRAMGDARKRSFRETLITQVSLIVVPSLLATCYKFPVFPSWSPLLWSRANWFFAGGVILTASSAGRLFASRRYRQNFIQKHLAGLATGSEANFSVIPCVPGGGTLAKSEVKEENDHSPMSQDAKATRQGGPKWKK